MSAFSLISKTADQPVATSITKDGAAVTIGHEPFVHEHGTAVHVKSLFASLPARRKFVRSARTEWRYIRAIIIQYMLRYPDIARTVSHNDKTIYTLTSAPDILTRISEIYDDETIAHLIPVSYGDQLRIE